MDRRGTRGLAGALVAPVLGLAPLAALLGFAAPALATDAVYLEPERFVAEAFAGKPPEPSILWLTGETRRQAHRILGHEPGVARVRYWRASDRTAWILEEIGKDQPITAGFVVQGDRLLETKVLVYRETRGWEVRLPAFTRQFQGAAMTATGELDRPIDNISGATLSVGALRRLARLALALDRAAGA